MGAVPAQGVEPGGPSDAIAFSGSFVVNASTPASSPPAVWWLGGSGTYLYQAGMIPCQLLYSDPDVPGTIELPTNTGCSLALAGGTFSSIACGTGWAASSASSTLTESGIDPDTTTITSYQLTYVAGLGIFTGTGSESDSGPASLAGVVLLTPNGLSLPTGGANNGPCTTGFTVTGVVAVTDGVLGA